MVAPYLKYRAAEIAALSHDTEAGVRWFSPDFLAL
jgi:hypothetical protein